MKILLVDFGSTFVKYSIYDTKDKEYVLSGKLPFPEPCVCIGERFEVSECDIRELVLSVFNTGLSAGCIRAYISVQMHGFLLRSRDGGFGNYVSWRDRTGISDGVIIDFFSRGTSRKRNLPYIKLCQSSHEDEEFYTLGSYIAFLLTGRNITHKTDGCASGFFQAEKLTADDTLGLTLPTLTHKVELAGTWNGIAIYTPVGDHQASYLGSGTDSDEYLINIGTATQVSCLDKTPCSIDFCEARPYFDQRRLITVTGLTGGGELYRGENPEKLYEELKRAINILPHRDRAVIGGGGSGDIYDHLSSELAKLGITCRRSDVNIAIEGLRIIAESQIIKIGTMLSEVAFTNFPIILKNTGIDFFIIDCEHGAFDYHTLSELITKAKLVGVKAIVRIGDNRREFITKLADMGASGFLLSMTGVPEDIEAVVRYAKYSPIGKRGISTTRAHTLYDPPKLSEYMVSANREMKIYAQIETAEGVENIASILNVNGVDGVFIGPNDLSDDLNCIGNNEPLKECIAKVAYHAEAASKPWGIITANHDLLEFSTVHKVNMISRGSELNMLIDGCKRLKEAFN